jgi:hypothetical protein
MLSTESVSADPGEDRSKGLRPVKNVSLSHHVILKDLLAAGSR